MKARKILLILYVSMAMLIQTCPVQGSDIVEEDLEIIENLDLLENMDFFLEDVQLLENFDDINDSILIGDDDE